MGMEDVIRDLAAEAKWLQAFTEGDQVLGVEGSTITCL